MKVALCLSGQPRSVKECYDYIANNLINPNSIEDIFIHLWWRPEFETTGIYGQIIEKKILNFIEYSYRPKVFVVENDKDKIFWTPEDIKSSKIGEGVIPGMFSMFYSRNASNLLRVEYTKKNNIQYDAIIFNRFDNYIRRPIIIDKFDLTAVNTTDYVDRPADLTYVNDIIIIGNEKIANIYASIYDNLPLISLHLYNFFGETILGKWFLMNNLTIHESMHYPGDVILYRTISEMRMYHPKYWIYPWPTT